MPPPKKTVSTPAARVAERRARARSSSASDRRRRSPPAAGLARRHVGVEVAVAAAVRAERHVDVDARTAAVPRPREGRRRQRAVGGRRSPSGSRAIASEGSGWGARARSCRVVTAGATAMVAADARPCAESLLAVLRPPWPSGVRRRPTDADGLRHGPQPRPDRPRAALLRRCRSASPRRAPPRRTSKTLAGLRGRRALGRHEASGGRPARGLRRAAPPVRRRGRRLRHGAALGARRVAQRRSRRRDSRRPGAAAGAVTRTGERLNATIQAINDKLKG